MGIGEADEEARAFVRKAKWVILPVWFALATATIALFLSGSRLAFVPFFTMIALAIGWNVLAVLKLRRIREKHGAVLDHAGIDADADVVGTVERSPLARLLLGLHAIGWSTPVQGSSPEPPDMVHQRLDALVGLVGAPLTSRQVPDGIAVEWKIHPQVSGTGSS